MKSYYFEIVYPHSGSTIDIQIDEDDQGRQNIYKNGIFYNKTPITMKEDELPELLKILFAMPKPFEIEVKRVENNA